MVRVPRQATTGGKPRLLRISKRGNGYLRMLLIHGARTALPGLAKKDTPLGRWVKALLARAHRNVVTVALANKLARIAWTVLAGDRWYVAVQTAANSGGRGKAAKYRGSHYSCEGKERDGLTVDWRPESLSTEMASRARPRILRGPGRADLHHGQSECSGAGYITAGLLETNSHESTCRPGAGHAFGTHNPLGGTVSKPYA